MSAAWNNTSRANRRAPKPSKRKRKLIDYEQSNTTKRGKLVRKSLYIASVSELAELKKANQENYALWFGSKLEKIRKIYKCIERAEGAGTADKEREAAWYLARTKAKQIGVQIEHIKDYFSSKVTAGISRAEINRRDRRPKPVVRNEGFVPALAQAIAEVNSVRTFSAKCDGKIEHAFYGVAVRTVAAVMDFVRQYNKIQTDGLQIHPVYLARRSWQMGVSAGLLATVTADTKALHDAAGVAEDQLKKARELKKIARDKFMTPTEKTAASEDLFVEDFKDELWSDSDDSEDLSTDEEGISYEDDEVFVDYVDEEYEDINLEEDINSSLEQILEKCKQVKRQSIKALAKANERLNLLRIADIMVKNLVIPKDNYKPLPPRIKGAFEQGVEVGKLEPIGTFIGFLGADDNHDGPCRIGFSSGMLTRG